MSEEKRPYEPTRHGWLARLWWRSLWSERARRDPFTGFLVDEYRRLTTTGKGS